MKVVSQTVAALLLGAVFTSTSGLGLAGHRANHRHAPIVQPPTKCELTFTLKGWSIVYKTASGNGVITCDNGQREDVKISARGGGLTAGKSQIIDAHGTFSQVTDIKELFGSYAEASATAAAGNSAEAHAMTKGSVSLTVTGKGNGMELGASLTKFTIKKK